MAKDKKNKPVNKIYKLIDLINLDKVMISADEIKHELLKIAKAVQKDQRKRMKNKLKYD